MRVLLAVSIILVVFISTEAVRQATVRPTAKAQGDGRDPTSCANVDGMGDGEGAVSLNDAVYILNWLFLGGPAPECPDPPRGVAPCQLLETGQNVCFNNAPGSFVDCDSEDFPGQDGFYRADLQPESRLLDNLDGTITDRSTGLTWSAEVSLDRKTWQEALRYCEDLELGTYDDWRMPNIKELQTLARYDLGQPAIDPAFTYPGPMPTAYDWLCWSSSTNVVCDAEACTDQAWAQGFYRGRVLEIRKSSSCRVIPVRGGPCDYVTD